MEPRVVAKNSEKQSGRTPVFNTGVGRLLYSGGNMQEQQPKLHEAWRCRREQYLRESGRHVELVKEGYASAASPNDWILVVGGRARNSLERHAEIELFLVKGDAS